MAESDSMNFLHYRAFQQRCLLIGAMQCYVQLAMIVGVSVDVGPVGIWQSPMSQLLLTYIHTTLYSSSSTFLLHL